MSDEYHMSLLSSWDEDFSVPKPGPCRADCGRMADEMRASDARIAELEETVARLTAPVTGSEAVAFTHDRLFTTAGVELVLDPLPPTPTPSP